MAEVANCGVAPHNPLGPIAGVAALHFDVATPNFVIQEEMVGAVPWYDEVVRGPIVMVDGCWQVPEAPGLGIEVDERVAAKHPFEQEVLHTAQRRAGRRHGGGLVMAGRLQDKVAIVTGGGRGIGEATARAMAAEGAKVVIAELDPPPASAPPPSSAACSCLATSASRRSCRRSRRGRSRLMAASTSWSPMPASTSSTSRLAMPEEEWRRCFAVDLDGVWHSCRAVLPTMLAQGGGSIVAIASCHSFAIIPHTFPYPVAKHGLLGLVRALGIEYAAKGVRVNAIAPGYIETQIAIDYWNTFPDPQAERQKAYDLHPPKRVGRPEEVAMTAVFLASDEAPFINAACITIDGGRSVLYHD